MRSRDGPGFPGTLRYREVISSALPDGSNRGPRVIVFDVSSKEMFFDAETLEILLDAKVRGLQITPIFGKERMFLGLLTTLWCIPPAPSAKELLMTEHYARFDGGAAGNGFQ